VRLQTAHLMLMFYDVQPKKNMGLIFDFRFRQERLCLTFFSQPLSVRFSGFKVPHTLSSCIQMKNKLKVWVNWIIWRIGRVKKANQKRTVGESEDRKRAHGPWAPHTQHTAHLLVVCYLLPALKFRPGLHRPEPRRMYFCLYPVSYK